MKLFFKEFRKELLYSLLIGAAAFIILHNIPVSSVIAFVECKAAYLNPWQYATACFFYRSLFYVPASLIISIIYFRIARRQR